MQLKEGSGLQIDKDSPSVDSIPPVLCAKHSSRTFLVQTPSSPGQILSFHFHFLGCFEVRSYKVVCFEMHEKEAHCRYSAGEAHLLREKSHVRNQVFFRLSVSLLELYTVLLLDHQFTYSFAIVVVKFCAILALINSFLF